MATKVIMPQLTTTMEEGGIDSWLRWDGEAVRAGEPILSVETDKAAVEIEAQADGILHTLYPEGTTHAVGTTIGWILAPGELLPETATQEVTVPSEHPESPIQRVTPPARRAEVRATPVARRLAQDRGIDLTLVSGSGPDGRIGGEDVLAYEAERLKKGARAEPESDQVPLSKVRRTTAERMSESFRSAPHFSISIEADMSNADRLRASWDECGKSVDGAAPSYTAILVSAVGQVLREHLSLNASFQGDSIKRYRDINIGVAVATEQGLIVPVVRNADKKPVEVIARQLEELQLKAKAGTFLPEEITGGTFTVSNLGMYGLTQFTAIINPPEAAILAVGGVADKPVVRQGQIVVRPIMNLTLSIDHRALDGVAGAEFLRDLKARLEALPGPSLG
jgi:pyruvate dehydrogenase E2 component (dihydrolipoamide acetyltransferase)